MIDTEVQPATKLPRDAKPSELVRGWPEDRWCSGSVFEVDTDGVMRRCAIGILSYLGGYDGPNKWWVQPCARFVCDTWQMPWGVAVNSSRVNDKHGKDAAADYLEAAGF